MEEKKDNNQTQLLDELGTPEPTTSQNNAAEVVTSKAEVSTDSQAATVSPDSPKPLPTKQVTQFPGIPEWVRTESGTLKKTQFRYFYFPDEASLLQNRFARAEYTRDPWERMPIPTIGEDYGTTEELFARIKLAIAEQTHLSDNDSALLTLWVFSTWFCDVLSLAPGLVIIGSAHDGDAVLRTLYAFCYHPILVAGMTTATLSDIRWDKKPTLLIFEPSLSKRSAGLLCSSTRRGYLTLRTVAGSPRSAFDYYSSKAIYVGEDPPSKAMLQHCIHINVSPTPGDYSQQVAPISEEMTQLMQNLLLGYRVVNLPEVSKLERSAAGFSPDFNAIASALGEAIVDAPDLYSELMLLLATYSDQQIAERLDDLGTLSVGAAFALCHKGKDQILVGEIAAEVNRILKGRGEKLQHRAEKVGHRLKNAGLHSRRLGAAGNGFVLDHTTLARLHEVAAAYGCVGLAGDDKNLHCSLCKQYK